MSFAKLVADKTNFTPGKNTKSFISLPYFANEARSQEAITGVAYTAGATSITVAATTIDLYEGTILCHKEDWVDPVTTEDYLFGDVYFENYLVVSAFAPIGSTTISVMPNDQTLASGEVRIPAWIPYFSLASHDITRTSTIITGNVHSDGFAQQKAQIGLDNSASTSGNEIWDDPALPYLRECVNTGKLVTVVRSRPLMRGVDCYQAYVSDFSDTAPDQEFMTQTGNFAITGTTYYGAPLPQYVEPVIP